MAGGSDPALGAYPAAVAAGLTRVLGPALVGLHRTLVYGTAHRHPGRRLRRAGPEPGATVWGIGAEPPSWAVAGATLAVAALFQPARRCIQQLVTGGSTGALRRHQDDRGVHVLACATHVHLDILSAERLEMVDRTMEPTKASLWLRRSTE